MKVTSRAPLRLGLAGGGTDVPPYRDIHGGAVLSTTISMYAYTIIETVDADNLVLKSLEHSFSKSICLREIGHTDKFDSRVYLHLRSYLYMIEKYNGGILVPLVISTFCDAPMGSGLGSSSAIIVSLIVALSEILDAGLDDYETANIAHHVERSLCGLHGGYQDHYSATFGGFNFMEFPANASPIIVPLRIKNWIRCEFESSLLMFYTSVSRESAEIIADQSDLVVRGDSTALESLHSIKASAPQMRNAFLRGSFSGISSLLNEAWESKKKLGRRISNSLLDNIYNVAIASGASAGKVSGAGGGGFMFFLVPPSSRFNVIESLLQFGLQHYPCHLTELGCQSWKD